MLNYLSARMYPVLVNTSDRVLHGRHKLLLVDDEEDVLQVLRQALELQGFEVDSFSSSRKALETFKPDIYDLAVIDVRMPGLNGIQLFREIKKIDPEVLGCFLSAFEVHPHEFEQIFPHIGAGIKAIIAKPVTVDKLVKEITPLLQISKINKAKSGDHILAVFETPWDLMEQTLGFIKKGLTEKYEDILLITDQMSKEAIREKINKELAVDVKQLEASGRFTLMTFQEWHLPDGKFDVERSVTRFVTRVQDSIEGGRKGLRSISDMSPFIDRGMMQELTAFESTFMKQQDLPVTAMCAYTKDSRRQLEALSLMTTLEQSHNTVVE